MEHLFLGIIPHIPIKACDLNVIIATLIMFGIEVIKEAIEMKIIIKDIEGLTKDEFPSLLIKLHNFLHLHLCLDFEMDSELEDAFEEKEKTPTEKRLDEEEEYRIKCETEATQADWDEDGDE